jgi:hypothetical protein
MIILFFRWDHAIFGMASLFGAGVFLPGATAGVDFRTDELDVIARQRLIGWQGKDARAQMLSDGKLAATHVYALRSRLQMDGGVVVHHRLHARCDTWASHAKNNMMAYENRLIASSHRSHMFLRSAKVGRRLHIPEIVCGTRGIYQHNVGVVSRFSAVDVPATKVRGTRAGAAARRQTQVAQIPTSDRQ